jgi:ArsR family transcriptional regulator, arsenate/arsenite/antimonite-responsive transcriptional repressor
MYRIDFLEGVSKNLYHSQMQQTNHHFNFELFFNALADRTRLRLLNLMGDDEVCVCFFVEVLRTNQPKISRHLAYLKKAGIVKARKEGLWMHYRVIEPEQEDAAQILQNIRQYMRKDEEMIADRERMIHVCCAPEVPESIQGAPIPASLVGYQCNLNC